MTGNPATEVWGAELCQPVLLRVEAEKDNDGSNVRLGAVYDLNWDPDLKRNLVSGKAGEGNTGYLGTVFGSDLLKCAKEYWRVDDTTAEWIDPATVAPGKECPWAF